MPKSSSRFHLIAAALFAVVGGILVSALPTFAQNSGTIGTYFEVEAINAGLPEPGSTVDRETPQSTMESFRYLTKGGQFADAAQLLDLREVPEGLRAEVGPELARKLAVVLKRRVWIDWGLLADRPDGVNPNTGNKDPNAGQPLRSIRLAVLDFDGRPVPIRMNRLKPKNGDAQWLFSRQSVGNIDGLFRLYGPTKLEQIMPDWLRGEVTLGLEIWELILLPLLLSAAAYVGLSVYRALDRGAESTSSNYAASLAAAVRIPFAIGTGTLVFWLTLKHLVSFNGVVSMFLDPLIASFLVLAAAMLLTRVVDVFLDIAVARKVDDLESDEGREDRNFYTNVSGARRLITVLALLFGAGVVLVQTNLLANLGFAALGGASLFTLILAFAGREALSNVMSSLQIAFSKPARIGDTLIFDDTWVTVEKINFTYVELRTWDGRRLIVPVNTFVMTNFENMSKRDPKMFRAVYLVLDHRAQVEEMRQAFFDFVRGDERTASMDDAAVEVIRHDRDGLHVRFKVNTTGPSAGWELSLEAREHLLAEARQIEERTGKPMLPIERELQVASTRDGLATFESGDR
ncbi:mechanosensitive ion channel family protein [Rhizobiaceae bacterium]|nr:mechanosensitive ion channel family protein [Rhizobiaceae bacterium]